MKIYTIGYTKKSAEDFFSLLKQNGVELLIDIRLNNKSQLSGFTKEQDLQFFLGIFNIEYRYCPEFAPTKELLSAYQRKEVSWKEYEIQFDKIMEQRGDYKYFIDRFGKYKKICLLCSEPSAVKCHRRLVAEKIKNWYSLECICIVHLH